jgi:hypothetical protein
MTDQGKRLIWESRFARLEAALGRIGEEINRRCEAEKRIDILFEGLSESPRLLNTPEAAAGTANNLRATDRSGMVSLA